MRIDDYLNELTDQIRDTHAKVFVAEEMKLHMEDQAERFMESGMSREEAISAAVKDMGDPVSVGTELDRIHRPQMEWRFFIYVVFISVLSIVIQFFLNRNMPVQGGDGIFSNLSRPHILQIILGLAVMLIIYRVDYTILYGKSRILGAAYLSVLTIFALLSGSRYNGASVYIGVGSFAVSYSALLMLYIPLFAGILYEYRGKGKAAVVKIILWMAAPILCKMISGNVSLPSTIFVLMAETILFGLALRKNWYVVNKKSLILGGVGVMLGAILISICFSWNFNGYRKARLEGWITHFTRGSYADAQGANYINSKLSEVFAHCNLIQESDEAISIMKDLPGYQSDLILGSIAAVCGLVGVAEVLILLFALAFYVFHISLHQRNSLGYIVGCACGIVIGLQSVSNVLIVFGLLPLTNTILPFFAGGFSFLLMDYCLLGLILSIYRYKEIRREPQPGGIAGIVIRFSIMKQN